MMGHDSVFTKTCAGISETCVNAAYNHYTEEGEEEACQLSCSCVCFSDYL